MTLSDWLRKRLELDAESAIELGTQEQILHVTGRHYIELLRRLFIPVIALLVTGGLAFYRSIGGTFFVSGADQAETLDVINWLLIGGITVLALIWLGFWTRGKKTSQAQATVFIAMVALGAIAVFRYYGGRVFVIDLNLVASQAADLTNLFLIGLAVVCAGAVGFISYDWLNDELIVTNQRVVYDNDQVIIPRLIEQRAQQQIFLEDIQDVNAATKTYLEHWLSYGPVVVKSARFNGNIVFEAANDPMRTQKAIMDQVRALRRTTASQDYGRLVAERVYGQKPPSAPKAAPQTQTTETQGWRWLRQIIPANPEINEATNQFTWRPHWLFLITALVGPFTLLAGGLLIIAIWSAMAAPDPLWQTIATALLALAFIGWSAWQVEDYRNDMYILTPDKVIDIEKKPFGPEDRREAGLSQVNNVSSKTTYLSNFLGYGDVVLSTAGGGGDFTFSRVPRPADVVDRITDYNVRAKRNDRYRPLNDTLELLKYYHDAQIQRDEINKPPA